MKRLGKIAVCLAGGLALNAGLRADDLAVANNTPPANPYMGIAARNIFGLNPPVTTTVDTNAQLLASLPKITPAGIMGVFGNLQVLFKVPAKPGTSAKDEYYTLSEGERQDGIEVIKIDDKNSLVTFENNGVTQVLPLANAPASSGTTVTSPSGGMNPGMVPGLSGGGNNGGGGFTRFGTAPGGRPTGAAGAPGFNSNNNNDGANGGVNFDNSSLQAHIYQPPASTLSPEEAQILLAAQHLKAIQENNPAAPLFPPSKIDKEAGIPSTAQ